MFTDAALGTSCTDNGDCDAGNNEVCDSVCTCNVVGGYAPGPTTTTTCYQGMPFIVTYILHKI